MSTKSRVLLNMLIALGILGILEGASVIREGDLKYLSDDTLGYTLVPSYREDGQCINAVGFRGPELRARADVSFRILCMGGSTTFGSHVDDDATWPRFLEKELRERGVDAEVLNGGVNGYGLEQVIAALRTHHLDEFECDLVLIYSGWNHASIADNPTIAKYREKARDSRSKGLLYHSAFVRSLDKFLRELRTENIPRVERVERRERIRSIMAESFPPLCRELRDVCKAHGVPVAMIIYPGSVQLLHADDESFPEDAVALLMPENNPGLTERELVANAIDQYRSGVDIVRSSARDAGLMVLDVAARLEEIVTGDGLTEAAKAKWTSYFRDRMHKSSDGNAAIGAVVADLLAETKLVSL